MSALQFEIVEITTKEEYARLNDVLWTANFHPYLPVFTACHPVTGHTPSARALDRALDTDLQWAAHESNPSSHLIYAIDKATGRVAGGCEWWIFRDKNPFPNGPQPVPCTWYPEGSERAEFASRFLSQMLFPRQCWFQRPHAGVNRMGVLPDYRRRGVGRLLMQWGHERIDTLGYESFIESSPMARWLYEECGYRVVMGLHIDMEKKHPGEEWERLQYECCPPGVLLHWRPPRGVWDSKVPVGPWAVMGDTWV
ncbi:GNAT family acetyltransferase [Aspergillus ellipticus CBS 707.79]|uniref:GNAT family acetyltransferase n=1 Tax=Aspergillus ellipticus CBS 707.79 TaxID=1448320 RepID=A0A319EDQ3_9EURO|nr:GNAT family acetyltransferase [Aspergillus ellipticus CBS 707.79]